MHRATLAVVVLLAFRGGAFAQSSRDKWYAQVMRFREQAQAAFDREMAREKAGDCREADNTRAIVDCMTEEIRTSNANYKAYTGALRSLLGMMGVDDPDQTPGPTGNALTSKELVSDFDAAEAAWQKYSDLQCRAAYGQSKGGTIAVPDALFCELMLLRSHMREIEKIYHVRLHN